MDYYIYVYNAGATYFESSLSFGRKSADTAQVDRLRDGHDGISIMSVKVPTTTQGSYMTVFLCNIEVNFETNLHFMQ